MTTESEIALRVTALEHNHEALERRLTDLDRKMEDNTKTTNAIKRDTEQIVSFFKASELGASALKWLAAVGSGAIVAYAAFKGIAIK